MDIRCISIVFYQNAMFISSMIATTALPNVAEFSRKDQDMVGEMMRVASRLIKYATIISVSTAARSSSSSLRDAVKRSLFGSTDGEESA